MIAREEAHERGVTATPAPDPDPTLASEAT